jgi:hypothetical protein
MTRYGTYVLACVQHGGAVVAGALGLLVAAGDGGGREESHEVEDDRDDAHVEVGTSEVWVWLRCWGCQRSVVEKW